MSITKPTSFFSILQNEGIIKAGKALDLGCGDFVDAGNLTKEGFEVDTVDIKDMKGEGMIHFTQSKIEDFEIKPDTYTFITAQMCLQFLSREDACKAMRSMVNGVVAGGVIVLTLIGNRDAWVNTNTRWDFWKREEADAFFAELPIKIHKVITREGEGKTKAGDMKFWHVFTYVLIRK